VEREQGIEERSKKLKKELKMMDANIHIYNALVKLSVQRYWD